MIKTINHIVNPAARQKAIERFREKGIVLPTFAQMRNPELVPGKIKTQLKNIGLWDLHPANLFRITWKNEPVAKGGLYGQVNYLEIPSQITGVHARIVSVSYTHLDVYKRQPFHYLLSRCNMTVSIVWYDILYIYFRCW